MQGSAGPFAGRQIPGQPLPDHGKQEYNLNFHRRQLCDSSSATPDCRR